MSEVRQKDRGQNDFQVFLKARALSVYTDTILANQNVFKCKSQIDISMLFTLSQCALTIYTESWQANNIRVTSKKSYLRRNTHQQNAISECIKLLALIDLSRKKFHLRKNKYLYWKDSAIEVKKLIYGWKESDNKRYAEFR